MATARKPASRRKADEISQELLLELSAWASTSKVSNDPYVKALSHALETHEDIESMCMHIYMFLVFLLHILV